MNCTYSKPPKTSTSLSLKIKTDRRGIVGLASDRKHNISHKFLKKSY